MTRSVAIAVIALFIGLALGLGYMTVRNTPDPSERAAGTRPAAGGAAPAAPARQLRLASSYSSSSPLLGARARGIATSIETLTGGSLDVNFREPGAPTPSAEVLKAVAAGDVEAGWTSASQLAMDDSAFTFFWGIPFGPRAVEYLAWLNHGGGRELMVDMFAPLDLMPLICGLLPAEGGGWFRKEIRSLDDLKDQKFRINGLGGEVLAKLGMEISKIPSGEVFIALQNGTLDAAEYSVPSVDLRFAFYKTAQHYYLPGWHQPLTAQLLVFNRRTWETLTDQQRLAVETACGDSMLRSIAEGEALQPAALKDMQARGVVLHTWPPAVMAAFEKAWQQVVAEQVAANPNFRKIWESYTAFRESYAPWRFTAYQR